MDDLSSDERRLVGVVADHLLATGGAHSPESLLEQLPRVRGELTALLGRGVDEPDEDPGQAAEAAGYLDELLEHADTDLGLLVDDRWYHPDAVCRGATATVRLDERAMTTGALSLGPDLAVLAPVLGRQVDVRGGGTAHTTGPRPDDGSDPFMLVLPAAAVPADAEGGDLLALRWDGDALDVAAVADPPCAPEMTADAVASLAATYVATVDVVGFADPVIEAEDLAIAARVDSGLFDEPLLPLSELVELAPLSLYGDHVASDDHDWEDWVAERAEVARTWRLATRYGLDAPRATLLRMSVDAVARQAGVDDVGPIDDEQVELLVEALDEPLMAYALVAETAYDDQHMADGLASLADRMRRIARGHDRAIAHHLLSAAAEAAGDVDEAARQASLGIRADARHPGSAMAASRFASLRGRASEALRHLHGAYEPDPGNTLEQLLRRHAAPGPADAPRNAPCPCGSGRKHKHCCASANGWPLATRTHWLLTKLRQHVTDPARVEEVGALADEMLADVADRVDDDAVHDLVANAFVQGLALWEGGALREFLDDYGPLLPADELDLGRRWIDAELELWEVDDVEPGARVSLLGLSTGERVEVRDIAMSESATVGGAIIARVLDGVDHVEVPAVWPVELSDRARVLALLASEDRHDAMAWASTLAMRMPRLTNSDGDEFELHTVTYGFDVDADTVDAALRMMFDDGDDGFVWIDRDDPEPTVLGTLRRAADTVVATTNSGARRDRLDEMLVEVFGDAVELLDESVADVEDLAEGLDDEAVDLSAALRPDQLPEEVGEALAAMMRQAEERWTEEPVPALGGLTPREALDDPTRRGDLLTLLDEFDDRGSRVAPGQTFDVDRLRQLLGLA